jgi:hypothetical protein
VTDLIEVQLANRTVNLTPTERDEWARRAVKVFQGMEYLMTAFARVLTGNPTVRLAMTAGTPHTDGKTIYYRPPLLLGDPSPHVRSQCDRRDTDGHLMCPACSAREHVVRSITHEIAHIAGDSFQKSDPQTQERTIRDAVQSARNPIAKAHLEAALRQVRWGDDVQTIMHKLSPFMYIVLLSLEDARIDLRMFKARPGTRKMFESISKRLMTGGWTDLDGQRQSWADRPLNAQILIGLLCTAEGFDLGNLHDKVIQDLKDPILQDICERVNRSGGPLEIASLAVECLCRLWEMGYCEPPEEMPPPPPYEPPPPPQEVEPEDESDDEDESDPEEEEQGPDGSADAESGEGSSSDNSGDEESSEEDSDSSSDDEGDSEPGPSDGDSAGGSAGDSSSECDSADEADQRPDSDEVSEPSSGGPSSEPSDEEDSDAGEADDSAVEGDGDGESGPDSDAGGESDAESDSDQDGDGGGDSDRPDDGDTSPGPDESEAESEGEESPDSGGDEPADQQQEADSTAGSGGESPDMGDEPDDAPDGGDPEGDGPEQPEPMETPGPESSDGAGDEGSEAGSEPASQSESGDQSVEPGDPGSTVGDEGDGDESRDMAAPDEADGTPDADEALDGDSDLGADERGAEDLPDDGTADDVVELIQDFTGHNHDEDEQVHLGSPDPVDEAAVDKAIVQNKNFDMPTATVYDVEVYTWPADDYKCEAWERPRSPEDLTLRLGDTDRAGNDRWDILRTPEEVLQPALFEMRRVFSDNRRTRFQRNLKKGKLDGRSLGRRAWKGDDMRLFQKQERPKSRSYAVIIGGDISWSTHGSEIVVEKQAMFAQAELCNRMGIDFEVWAHTADGYSGPLRSDFDEDAYVMQMHRVKGWTDPWNAKTQEGLAWLHSVSTNLDGHTLEFYRKRLMTSNATTKILLYYTDGAMPAANYDDELEVLKREVDIYKRLGIVMLGVGVGTDSPKRWGMDTVRINNKGDITKVIKHLEGVLTGINR